MKKVGLLLLVIVFAVSMLFVGVSCKTTTAAETTAVATTAAETTAAATTAAATTAAETTAAKKLLLAHSIQASGDIWRSALDKYCRAAAAKLTDVDYKVWDAMDASGYNMETQIAQIEEMIPLKPDCILVAGFDKTLLIEPVRKAFEAGINVITEMGLLEESAYGYLKGHVGSDPLGQGKSAAEIMEKGLKEKFGDDLTGKAVVILRGSGGQEAADAREKGFTDRLTELAPEVKVLEIQVADWDKAKGTTVMETLLVKYPKIDGVYGENDAMALGAIIALEEANRLKDVVVVSVDAVKEGRDAIKAGKLYGAVFQSPEAAANMMIGIAYKIAKGEEVEFFNLFESPIVTKENVGDIPD